MRPDMKHCAARHASPRPRKQRHLSAHRNRRLLVLSCWLPIVLAVGLCIASPALAAFSYIDTTAKTGLEKPAMTVLVKFDDGKKEERVTFVKDGADVLVVRPGEPGAAKTDAADLTETLKSLDELSK